MPVWCLKKEPVTSHTDIQKSDFMKIEAIAVDIDGTITDEKRRICISAIEAIRAAEAKGIPTIIVTGNVVNYAYATAVLIGATGGLVCENGGLIFKEGTNNNEVQPLADRTYVDEAQKYIEENVDSNYKLHLSSDNIYRLTEIVYYKTVPKEVVSNALKGFENEEKIAIYDSGFALHITDSSVNKGFALKKLCEQNGIDINNVMAVGDSENDKEFLKETGLKIAVANADDALKEMSDYTCKKRFGDGVKEAIEKFVL